CFRSRSILASIRDIAARRASTPARRRPKPDRSSTNRATASATSVTVSTETDAMMPSASRYWSPAAKDGFRRAQRYPFEHAGKPPRLAHRRPPALTAASEQEIRGVQLLHVDVVQRDVVVRAQADHGVGADLMHCRLQRGEVREHAAVELDVIAAAGEVGD